ncbi:MAG: CapA family protein [Tissierellia bacterium]|nr:CapA family protein [Tissierellia bacterium]
MKKAIIILTALLLLGSLTACGNRPGAVDKKTQGAEAFAEEPQRPAPEKKEEPLETSLSLVAFGDFMLHRPQIEGARVGDDFDFTPVFALYQKDIEERDLAMINLETTLTDQKTYTTYPVFRSPEEVARDLSKVGFDVLNTANNHAYDGGQFGLEYTLDKIREAGMGAIGTTEVGFPVIYESNGILLGLISYTYGLNGFESSMAASDSPYVVSLLTEENIERDVSILKEDGVDAIVAFVHWGEEYHQPITAQQEHYAQFFHDQGVDLILGSHPHIPQTQGVIVGERPTYIAYSMGNFYTNQRPEEMGRKNVDMGLATYATFTKKGEVTEVTEFNTEAFHLDRYYGEDGRRRYVAVPAARVLEGAMSYERTEEIRGKLEGAHREYLQFFNPDALLEGADQ